MKIYKNDEKETAWINAGYISEKGKSAGKRITKKLDLDFESTKGILEEDWTASQTAGEPNGDFYHKVEVPLILGESKGSVSVPGIYDAKGRVIVAPYEKDTGKTVYFIDWDAMAKKV